MGNVSKPKDEETCKVCEDPDNGTIVCDECVERELDALADQVPVDDTQITNDQKRRNKEYGERIMGIMGS